MKNREQVDIIGFVLEFSSWSHLDSRIYFFFIDCPSALLVKKPWKQNWAKNVYLHARSHKLCVIFIWSEKWTRLGMWKCQWAQHSLVAHYKTEPAKTWLVLILWQIDNSFDFLTPASSKIAVPFQFPFLHRLTLTCKHNFFQAMESKHLLSSKC